MSRSTWVGWGCFAGVVGAGLIRAATAGPPADSLRASETVRREAFAHLAREESTWRELSAKEFPGDAWSQDDDFYNRQERAADAFANRKGISIADVLRGFDEGMREGWPRPRGLLRPTVEPCRPRPEF